MKKNFYISLLCMTSFFFLAVNPISAAETDNSKISLISTDHAALTGDNQKEKVELKGILFSSNSGYYHNVWADINGPQTKQWKIAYDGGYEPELMFIDLNHDNIDDIFYQNTSGGSGGLHHYQLHTLKNEQLKKLPLPEPHFITGHFTNDFKAVLNINPGQKPIIIDVTNHAANYTNLGVYDKKGTILKETQLIISPIAYLKPIIISKSKGYGLKSFQPVSGIYRADRLGTIESLWYFENDKWIKLKTDWVPANGKD